MAVTTGKKLRRFVDGAWERVSFWHKASDCEMDNGKNLEEEIQDIKDNQSNAIIYNENVDSYQGYIDSQWKDIDYAGFNWDGYIVKDGIMNDKVCGGLIVNDGGYHDFEIVKEKHVEGTMIKIHSNVKKIYLDKYGTTAEYNRYNGSIHLDFLKPIDLTNYNEIKIEFSCFTDSAQRPQLSVHNDCYGKSRLYYHYNDESGQKINSKYILNLSGRDYNSGKDILTYDISNIIGKCYITFIFYFCITDPDFPTYNKAIEPYLHIYNIQMR